MKNSEQLCQNSAMQRVSEEQMARALQALQGRILLFAHLNPDGDAYGAMRGLCLALRTLGKDASAVLASSVAEQYRFLEESENCFVLGSTITPSKEDVCIALDCGDLSRIDNVLHPFFQAAEQIFCIDHHKSSEGFGTGLFLCEPEAGASCEILVRILQKMQLPFSRNIAEALWVGIVTDTGRLTFSCTSPATLQAGSELLKNGVRSEWLGEILFSQQPLRRLRLQRRLLGNLQVTEDHRIAMVHLTADDFAAEGCVASDSEQFVVIARNIRGCDIAAFVRQPEPGGTVNLSLRAREPYDAAEICARWGGGGHARAAGCTFTDESLESVCEKVWNTLCRLSYRSDK